MIVEIVAAYVDGRPIPCSSSALMSVASVKRGGGSVKCWVGVTSSTVVAAPSARSGSRALASSSSSADGVVAALGVDAEKPSKRTLVARRPQLVAAVGELDRRRLELLRRHLRRERALPDQPVEAQPRRA